MQIGNLGGDLQALVVTNSRIDAGYVGRAIEAYLSIDNVAAVPTLGYDPDCSDYRPMTLITVPANAKGDLECLINEGSFITGGREVKKYPVYTYSSSGGAVLLWVLKGRSSPRRFPPKQRQSSSLQRLVPGRCCAHTA